MVFILSLYGGVMAGEDERRGLFMPLGIGLRLPCRLAAAAAPGALACLSVFVRFFWAAWQREEALGLWEESWGFCFYMDAAVRYLPLG